MNMNATTTTPATTAFLDAVRIYLSDLPEHEREDLMADIEQHVAEVAAEWDGPLTTILGSPLAFVDDYRQSAHVPVAPPSPEPPPLLDRAVRLVERLRTSDQVSAANVYLHDARPGWWGIRGYIGATSALQLLTGSPSPTTLDPAAHGLIGIALIALSMFLSIHLGRRSQKRTWRRRLAILVNVAVVLLAFTAGSQLRANAMQARHASG